MQQRQDRHRARHKGSHVRMGHQKRPNGGLDLGSLGDQGDQSYNGGENLSYIFHEITSVIRLAKGHFMSTDLINQPPHYTYSKIEPIDVVEAWELPYHLACVVKYISRAEHKGTTLSDLKKARWYLDRYIKGVEDGRF